jgi:hypothetical protein
MEVFRSYINFYAAEYRRADELSFLFAWKHYFALDNSTNIDIILNDENDSHTCTDAAQPMWGEVC